MSEVASESMPFDQGWGVAGRRYLITGTGPGMGGHSARLLVRAGATVACCDVKPEVVESLVAEIGPGAVALSGDITKESVVERVVAEAADKLGGPLDGLVDIVGTGFDKSLADQSIEEFDVEISANLRHAFLLSRLVGPQLGANADGGAMVFISSIVAQSSASLGGFGYAVAKSGLDALIRSAAVELGPLNVRVNGIAPGFILTERLAGMWPQSRLDNVTAQTPLRRLGTPANIAASVYYLLSSMSSHVSGQIINVDGGVSRKFGYNRELI